MVKQKIQILYYEWYNCPFLSSGIFDSHRKTQYDLEVFSVNTLRTRELSLCKFEFRGGTVNLKVSETCSIK